MLQQSHTPDNQANNQSPLSPTSSPQPDSTGAVQGAASQQLLQSEGQTITAPSSSGASTEQTGRVVARQDDVRSEVSFQPIEIVGIFAAVVLVIIATAFYVIKKSKKSEVSQVSRANHSIEAQEINDIETEQVSPVASNKRRKKSTRRQRRQQQKQ